MIVPPSEEHVLANGAELKRWDAYNQQLFSVLLLSTKDVVNSLLGHFAERSDSRQQPDGQAVCKAMIGKYLDSSMQWKRNPMKPNKDPNRYLTDVF